MKFFKKVVFLRGHATSGYIDVGLMGIGSLLFLAGDVMTGVLLGGVGLLIHVAMGD